MTPLLGRSRRCASTARRPPRCPACSSARPPGPTSSPPSPGPAPRVLALAGPTASGKTALAHAAALAVGGEIIVADPFARYRGLEIAADSPRAAALGEVPHHAVGDLDLTQGSTAASFGVLAHASIDASLAAGRVPIVTGGTGLYLRAALADLRFPDPAHPLLRNWAERLAREDPEAALAELRRRDPERADRIDAANPRRVARALEIAAAGEAGAGDDLWTAPDRHPTLVVGLTRPREVLDRLIAERVRRELDEGLVAEVERVLDTPGVAREPLQVIGAKEVLAIRAGALDPAELPERLAARTRRLARKQLTWLRRMPGVTWLDVGDAPAATALPELLELYRGPGGHPVPSGG